MGANGIELGTFAWFTSGLLTLVGWFLLSPNIYLPVSFIADHYIIVYSPQKKKKNDRLFYASENRRFSTRFFSSSIIFKAKHACCHVEFMKIMDAICVCNKAF
jgi:hypothetical protein